MDVSALNLATIGAMPEEGALAAPGASAIGAAAFATMLSGLGVAAQPAGTDPVVPAAPVAPIDMASVDGVPAEGEVPPVDPVLLIVAPVAVALPKGSKGDTSKPSPPVVSDEREPATDTEMPTTASLGLPPLLAALVAPTLAQAAPVQTAPTARDGLMSSEPALTLTPVLTGSSMPAMPTAGVTSAVTVPPPATAVATLPVPPAPVAAPSPAEQAAAADPVAPVIAAAIASPGKPAARAASPSAPAATEPVNIESAAPSRTPVATVAAPPAQSPSPAAAPPPRRAASAQPTGLDAVVPSKSREKPATIVDAAAPLASRPLPVAPALAPAPDLATAVPSAAPAEAALPAEPLIEHQLDMAREGEWLDQLTRDIVRTASTEGSLRFRLNPEHLGSLQVELTQGQAGASVRLTADTEQARSLIADARPQLVAEARAQGVRIAEAHVDLSGRGEGQAGGQSAPQSQAGNGGRGGREVPVQEYLTSWQPESAEEEATPSRRSAAERYA